MARATARTYALRLQQHLGPGITALFPEFSVRHAQDGTTVLTGRLPDQSALHGALGRVRDLGLVLESVRCLHADGAADGEAAPSATGDDPR